VTKWSPEAGLKEKHLFERLSEEKKERIMHACIDEFARAGYLNASTNKMVRVAGISKGSLFKYFISKNELYMEVINHILEDFFEYVQSKDDYLKEKDILERLKQVTGLTFSFFRKKPALFRLLMRVKTDGGMNMMEQLKEKWEPKVAFFYGRFFSGIDFSVLSLSPEEFIRLWNWIDYAIDSEVLVSLGGDSTMDAVEAAYESRLGLIHRVLKNGIYKKEKK